jgi:hypothetical protein
MASTRPDFHRGYKKYPKWFEKIKTRQCEMLPGLSYNAVSLQARKDYAAHSCRSDQLSGIVIRGEDVASSVSVAENRIDGRFDIPGAVGGSDMLKHHCGRKDATERIGLVLPGKVRRGPGAAFEHRFSVVRIYR